MLYMYMYVTCNTISLFGFIIFCVCPFVIELIILQFAKLFHCLLYCLNSCLFLLLSGLDALYCMLLLFVYR